MADEFGDRGYLLLVRPFVLRDAPEAPDSGTGDDSSDDPWPAGGTREVRSHRANAGADRKRHVTVPGSPSTHRRRARPSRGRRGRRQLLIVAGTGAALIGALVAGLLAVTDGGRRTRFGAPDATAPAVAGPGPDAAVSAGQPSGTVAATDGTNASPALASPPAGLPVTGPASSSPAIGSGGNGPATTGTAGSWPIVTRAAGNGPAPSGAAGTGPAVTGAATLSAGGPGTPDGPPSGVTAPASPAGRTGTIRSYEDLCLEATGAGTGGDSAVGVAGCDGTEAQRWTLSTDGTLRAGGRCALAMTDRSVRIGPCDGRTGARWRTDRQTVVDEATARCLTAPPAAGRSGIAVTVTTCSGSPRQQWVLP